MESRVNPSERFAVPLVAALLVLAALLAYGNSFQGPFVFDDIPGLVENSTLRSFAAAWSPPPGGLPVSGRPAVNVTFALSHALSGDHVWGYHALNLLIHMLAGLTLFGVVRQTLLLPPQGQRPRVVGGASGEKVRLPEVAGAVFTASFRAATWFAAAVALLWTLHPLQTESVTYLVQRAESLVGLFYLLTLYAFVRAAQSGAPLRWQVVSVIACLLGMASKEVMATAPIVIFLFDRTFVAGTFRGAWQRRWKLYLAYGATWMLLALLVFGSGSRGGTAGFGLNITPWSYLMTQGQAIVRYLGLAFWPRPLVLDYGLYLARGALATVPFLVIVMGLLAGTVVALRRWPVAGFLGAVFFLILAPTSSVVPVATQTMAEHRMYLPLATVVIGVTWALSRGLGRSGWVVLGVLAVGWGGVTVMRNRDYRSGLVLWTDTVAKRPDNFRARYNRALQLMDAGLTKEAVVESGEAVGRDPENPDSHYNHSLILTRVGRFDEAVAAAQESLRLRPWFADAHVALGNAWLKQGKAAEALSEFQQAMRLRPDSSEAPNNVGVALTKLGRATEALPFFDVALRLKPDSASAHSNRGDSLGQLGRIDEAMAEINTALQLKPDLAEAHYTLASTLLRARRAQEAVPQFEEALRLTPDFYEAHLLLGGALVGLGRVDEGLKQFAEALRLAPGAFEVHFNLANTLFQLGRVGEAIPQYQEALKLKPDFAVAHYNLGHAWLQENRTDDAIREFKATLQLNPDHVDARFNLGNCWLVNGHPAEALPEFEEVVRRAPGSADGLAMLGKVLLELNRPAEAVPHLEEALRLKPDLAEVREDLARARASSNHRRG